MQSWSFVKVDERSRSVLAVARSTEPWVSVAYFNADRVVSDDPGRALMLGPGGTYLLLPPASVLLGWPNR